MLSADLITTGLHLFVPKRYLLLKMVFRPRDYLLQVLFMVSSCIYVSLDVKKINQVQEVIPCLHAFILCSFFGHLIIQTAREYTMSSDKILLIVHKLLRFECAHGL